MTTAHSESAVDLARDVRALLELQAKFFDAPKGSLEKAQLLKRCKGMEAALREKSKGILGEGTPTLFDATPDDGEAQPGKALAAVAPPATEG